MVESFFDFLDGPIKVEDLIPFVLGYIVLMWIMFSLWVLIDAKKRYENIYIAVAFFLLVLPVNFPALIFYLIIRPEGEEELYSHLVHSDHSIPGGVNVPIANFIGKEGVDMSINLQIYNPEITKQKDSFPSNLDVQLKWDYDEKQLKITEDDAPKKKPARTPITLKKSFSPVQNLFKKVHDAISISEKDILGAAQKKEDAEEPTEEPVEKHEDSGEKHKRKHKKKKR